MKSFYEISLKSFEMGMIEHIQYLVEEYRMSFNKAFKDSGVPKRNYYRWTKKYESKKEKA